MWLAPFALRPVPRYAQIPRAVLLEVERHLTGDDDSLDERAVQRALGEFERRQPVLGARIARLLRGARDDAAVALGYFLILGSYLAFERAFGARLRAVDAAAFDAVQAALRAETELRAERSADPIELEDVLAALQPALFGWVAEHTEGALSTSAELEGIEVDLDDLDAVLGEVSAVVLALSYAVTAPAGIGPVVGQA